MKNANQFKKFQFFEVIEGDARSNRQTAEIKSNVTYVLNDVTPIDMKTIDNFLFLSTKLRIQIQKSLKFERKRI